MASLEDPTPPATRLIAAHAVQGTSVYNTALERLGTVEDIMLDKVCGRIAYAVLRFGGFPGIGDRHYPLPWGKLAYNDELSGYTVDVDRATLEGAPAQAETATRPWEQYAWAPES